MGDDLGLDDFSPNSGSIETGTTKDFIETHIYDTEGEYLAYNSSDPNRMSEQYTESGVLPITFTHHDGVINLNLAEETRKLGFTQGKYITTTNVLSSILSGNVYIDEISPSRKEIRIRPVEGRFQDDYFQKYHILNEFYFFGIKSKLVNNISEILAMDVDFNNDGGVNILDLVTAINTFNSPQFAVDNGLVDVNGDPLVLDTQDFQVILDYILYLILGDGTYLTHQTQLKNQIHLLFYKMVSLVEKKKSVCSISSRNNFITRLLNLWMQKIFNKLILKN